MSSSLEVPTASPGSRHAGCQTSDSSIAATPVHALWQRCAILSLQDLTSSTSSPCRQPQLPRASGQVSTAYAAVPVSKGTALHGAPRMYSRSSPTELCDDHLWSAGTPPNDPV